MQHVWVYVLKCCTIQNVRHDYCYAYNMLCSSSVFILAALWNTAGHYIFTLWFLSSAFFYLFSFLA